MTRSDIPNIISVLRICLVPILVWQVLEAQYANVLVLFFIAGFSDGLDGFLAKRYGWVSRLGSILDPIADKFLLVSSFLALGWMGEIPLWLVVAVIVRDVVIVAGAYAYHRIIGEYELKPSYLSKLNTVSQISLVLVVVSALSIVDIDSLLIQYTFYFVMITTLLSGFDYIYHWGIRAWRHRSVSGRFK
ncbi:MAG: CDP-alcohol phosphatidyltransferase family protein [Gammaproteobacteria bacterium]|nr:CDP-alcohol phosphatidyltransferase family protein [Gammaproteobacteria bacterium]